MSFTSRPATCRSAAGARTGSTGLWLSLCLIRPRAEPSAVGRPDIIWRGQAGWRLLADTGQQTWKACWGTMDEVRTARVQRPSAWL